MAVNFINPGVFTIGPNNSVSIIDIQTGAEIDFGDSTIIMFSSQPVNQRTPVNLMSGIKEDLVFDQGWRGDFTVQRTNSKIDVFWSILEAQVRAGVTRPLFNIIQNIRESDGTLSQYTILFCQITYDDAGSFENEAGVVQKFSFTSPAREAINS
jgi:hypothetical protein